MCMCEKEEEKDMAIATDKVQEKIAELRKKLQIENKNIPILKEGNKKGIELDPNNPSHNEWYEGR